MKIRVNEIKLLDKNNKKIPIKYANFDINKKFTTKYNINNILKKIII